MRLRILLAALTTLFGLGVAAYGSLAFPRLRTFYRWVVVALWFIGALSLLGWWRWWNRQDTSDLVLLQNFCSVCVELGLGAWLAHLLGQRRTALILAGLLGLTSIGLGLMVPILSRPQLYIGLCLAGVAAFLALSVGGYDLIRSKHAEDRDLVTIPYFWCLLGFLLMASGSATEYVFHFWITVLGHREFIVLHGWVANMPSVLAFSAFARAFLVESRGH